MPAKKAEQISSGNASRPPAPIAAQAPLPMELEVRINSIQFVGTTRATASVNVNGQLAIRGIKVKEGSNGLFVSMPSFKVKDDDYKEYCFPVTKEFREQLHGAVLDGYKQALRQAQEAGTELAPPTGEAVGFEPSM